MENVYLYEGDFISLLSLIMYLLKNNIKPSNIKKENYFPSLIENTIYLSVDKNEKIIEQLTQILGSYIIRSMFYVFLSSEENKELILYYFLLNALKYKEKVIDYRNLKCVREVLRISTYVSREAHRMKGFLRFKELKSHVLYAEMEPTNDILFLLSCHFSKRLKNEFWIIKDNKRKILSIYDKNKFAFFDEKEVKIVNAKSSEEENIETLWKTFYRTIGIKERKNDRCRMNFMPKKYWKYITEVKEEI